MDGLSAGWRQCKRPQADILGASKMGGASQEDALEARQMDGSALQGDHKGGPMGRAALVGNQDAGDVGRVALEDRMAEHQEEHQETRGWVC